MDIITDKYNGYQHGLASVVYEFFDKKSCANTSDGVIVPNLQLAEELHEPLLIPFKKKLDESNCELNKI